MTTIDMKLSPKSEWIEMFPFGIVMGANNVKPVMVFKDKTEDRVLPVWLSPIDAGIAMAQSNSPYRATTQLMGSPHEVAGHVMQMLGVTLEKCLFKKVTKHQQFVELHFRAPKSKKSTRADAVIDIPADDAISFCLRSGCKFFATVDYIESSRVLENEGMGLSLMPKDSELPPRYLN